MKPIRPDPVSKRVTTAVDQTLTCIIEGLDSNYPVWVTWTDAEGEIISTQDYPNYEITQERVYVNGSQSSLLTIRQYKLQSFAGSSSFKFGCSAESTQYQGSPPSNPISVHAEVLKLEVITLNAKSLTGTETKLTCEILGLTRKLESLRWTTSRGADITNNVLGYSTDAPGYFNGTSQTTTLKIAAEQNDGSTSYNCVVASYEHGVKELSTAVIFKNNIGWTAVTRDELIPFPLESTSLEIRTDSRLGSGDTVAVFFYEGTSLTSSGGVYISFSSTPRYLIYYCTSSYTDFPVTLPSTTDKIWRITLTRSSGVRVTIHCNNEEVANVLLSDTSCDDSMRYFWNRETAYIMFSGSDTASDYYREAKYSSNQIYCTWPGIVTSVKYSN
ncbi:uncharacterized protein LOC134816881 [Bolinopsis microptera]|uniref:uncharacterized protein LOC134816881 n=1 Tax=Bolinopsis microptera TaxID=2820187 RepID=UPI00307918A9